MMFTEVVLMSLNFIERHRDNGRVIMKGLLSEIIVRISEVFLAKKGFLDE